MFVLRAGGIDIIFNLKLDFKVNVIIGIISGIYHHAIPVIAESEFAEQAPIRSVPIREHTEIGRGVVPRVDVE